MTPERRQAVRDEAVAAAREANAALVFAYDEGTEFRDRTTLALPGYQDELVAAVAQANPRTTVVLNTGDPVLMPWLDDAGAILQMWYPGQEGADATAAVLTGELNPAGKLPVTFPRTDDQTPVNTPERYPGVDGMAEYEEGVLVGYRWYDAMNEEPLFPFGHGESYATFTYGDLRVEDARLAGDGETTLAVDVENVADRPGSEVVQLYASDRQADVVRPEQELVGFQRVDAAAGERVTVEWRFPAAAVARPDADGDPVVSPGRLDLRVGRSADEIRATESVTVTDRGYPERRRYATTTRRG